MIFDILWLDGNLAIDSRVSAAPRAPRRARAPGAGVADAVGRLRRRRGVRHQSRARIRRRRRETRRLHVRARPAFAGVAQGQAPAAPGVRRGRLGDRPGRARTPDRRAPRRLLRRRRRAALRGQGRHRVLRRGARTARARCSRRSRRRTARSPIGASHATRTSWSPCWWRRCGSRSGRPAAGSGIPRTSASATTKHRTT